MWTGSSQLTNLSRLPLGRAVTLVPLVTFLTLVTFVTLMIANEPIPRANLLALSQTLTTLCCDWQNAIRENQFAKMKIRSFLPDTRNRLKSAVTKTPFYLPVLNPTARDRVGLAYLLFDSHPRVRLWGGVLWGCLLYTSPSPRDKRQSRMPSSA